MKVQKVYIVIGSNGHNDISILGVFLSKRKAQNFQEEAELCDYDEVYIETYDLNKESR